LCCPAPKPCSAFSWPSSSRAFEQLPKVSIVVHAASLLLVALAVMMLMAPAPYHRIVYAGEDTEDMYRVSSTLVTGATVPLGLGLAARSSS
jgi:hypothetical protein